MARARQHTPKDWLGAQSEKEKVDGGLLNGQRDTRWPKGTDDNLRER
jgi:hypothetical protein